MRTAILTLSAVLLATSASADWFQWGRDSRHEGAARASGRELHRIEHEVVLDPFANTKKAESNGNLVVHYQAPVVDGNDLYLVVLSGSYTNRQQRNNQVWNVRNLRHGGGGLTQRWNYASSWKPVPTDVAFWEPVYHVALTADSVWAYARGGAIDRISRADGTLIKRYSPFGETVDQNIYAVGPPAADEQGNVFYDVVHLQTDSFDPLASYLVRIGADGSISKVTYEALTPNAPKAEDLCLGTFFTVPPTPAPWPPSPNAVPASAPCGPQQPGMNAAPAIGPDGTIYVVSSASRNGRHAYLVAVNPDLTPKWASSMRNRFNDGCGVLIPPNGTPGGCREGTTLGIDPADNQPGSGSVSDDSTSSPVVTPDGKILYGAQSSYVYSQGHLMKWAADGTYEGSYPFGWDMTPSISRHGSTYSIVMKENHYAGRAYCSTRGSNATVCPITRTPTTADPEAYYITSLDPSLKVEWQFKSTETKSCERNADGTMTCVDDHPAGFEWCINSIAVDDRGVIYANSEDGHLYAINPNGTMRQRIFLRLALGAAYTPLSIGRDGRIYTQNDGRLFIITGAPRRRAAAGR